MSDLVERTNMTDRGTGPRTGAPMSDLVERTNVTDRTVPR